MRIPTGVVIVLVLVCSFIGMVRLSGYLDSHPYSHPDVLVNLFKPAPPSIRVVAINYQRSEITGVTRDDMGKAVRIVAHCQGACPASLGTHAAGPESVYYFNSLRPDIISQSEER